MNKCLLLINLVMLLFLSPSLNAEGLGKLFTTPKERALLESLRHHEPVVDTPKKTKYEPIKIVVHDLPKPPKPVVEHKVVYEPEFNPETIEKEQPENEKQIVVVPAPEIPKITVNGIVKRSGGKSTAWINGVNTYDGYFDPQHIKVNPRRIGKDHVHIETEDTNIGEVSLKVGQTLVPEKGKIVDTYQKALKNNHK